MKENLQNLLNFLVETAYLAGRSTLSNYQTGVHAEYKVDHTPVTIADKRAEELIRKRIEDQFPGHQILGEEFGASTASNASHRWIIDPIDGTKSFLRGIPLYAVLIGLEIEHTPVAGAAYFPALDEMLAAANGLGCWWNGRRAHVSEVARLNEAWVTCTDSDGFSIPEKARAWQRVKDSAYVRGGWGDAYGYLLVATGRVEVMADPVMAVWDCGPFPAILSEAGGYFGDWSGNITLYGKEGLATNGALKAEVLELLQS